MSLLVAVDLDEVLGQFLSALLDFHNDRYQTSLTMKDFHSYTFRLCWGGDEEESTAKVQAFFTSPNFLRGIPLVPGARHGLECLKQAGFRLAVVTSRQLQIEEHTRTWLARHFGEGFFDEVVFGNHWGIDGRKKRSKREMCESLGAEILIDDSVDYACEVAQSGIRVLLFDLDHSYGWNKADDRLLSPKITRVSSWDEVVSILTRKPQRSLSEELCTADDTDGYSG